MSKGSVSTPIPRWLVKKGLTRRQGDAGYHVIDMKAERDLLMVRQPDAYRYEA